MTMSIQLGEHPETLLVDEVEEEMTHYLLNLSQTESIVFQTVVGANLISGSLFGFLLFKGVWNDGGFSKPINVMTGIFSHVITFLY